MGNIKLRIPTHQKLRVFYTSSACGEFSQWWALHPGLQHVAAAETPLDAIKLYFATFNKD